MATPKTVKLMVDGELQDALVRVDANGEWACKTTSGRVFFFPQADSEGNSLTLAEQVKAHNAANGAKPIFAADVDADPFDEEWENFGSDKVSNEPETTEE